MCGGGAVEAATAGGGPGQAQPAGLTGWAQVYGLRGDNSIAERARFENYYIENSSPGLDLISVVTRRGG